MRISDWSSDVCSSDLSVTAEKKPEAREAVRAFLTSAGRKVALFVRINPLGSGLADDDLDAVANARPDGILLPKAEGPASVNDLAGRLPARGAQDASSEEHTSEFPSLMRISYAVL